MDRINQNFLLSKDRLDLTAIHMNNWQRLLRGDVSIQYLHFYFFDHNINVTFLILLDLNIYQIVC